MAGVRNQGAGCSRQPRLRRLAQGRESSSDEWKMRRFGAALDAQALGWRSARSGDAGVLLAELVHAARGVDHLLLAGVKRMAVGAHVETQVVPDGRARL